MMIKKRGLGRGLEALLATASTAPAARGGEGASTVPPLLTESIIPGVTPERPVDGELRNLPIDLIQRGKYQPRTDMKTDKLEDLANSIRAQGVVQPILVRRLATPGHFEIIAGERRWRAAQLAGLQEIPAVIRDVPDEAALAMALIENIQREGLNPLEEATALARLVNEFSLTHQEVADAVGRSRAAVSNLLRLLELGDDVKHLVENGELEMGHARALLGLPATMQGDVARRVVAKGMSVRETESLVRRLLSEGHAPKVEHRVDPDIQRFSENLSERLGAAVQIHHSEKGKGKLVISYNSLDELEGILGHIQ